MSTSEGKQEVTFPRPPPVARVSSTTSPMAVGALRSVNGERSSPGAQIQPDERQASPYGATGNAASSPSGAVAALNLESIQLEGAEDPRKWSQRKKWTTTAIISGMGFIAPLGSSILVPGSGLLGREFHLHSRTLSILPVSVFVLGLGVGPFVLAPASELKGRQPIYLVTSIIFVLFNIGTALSNNNVTLNILRFIAGAAGSSGPSLGAGSIGDLFEPRERGRAQSLYGLGPLMGPVIGNVIGSWIAQEQRSWRWLLWVLTILSGVITGIVAIFLGETFAPVLLRRKRERILQEHLKQFEAARRLDSGVPPLSTEPLIPNTSSLRQRLSALVPSQEARTKLKQALSRPFRLLFTNPICAIFSIYMGFCYGIIFLFLTQHPLLFQRRDAADAPPPPKLPTYNWSIGVSGLTYLGLGLGFLTSAFLNVMLQDVIYQRLVASDGQIGVFLFKHKHEIVELMRQNKFKAKEVDEGALPNSVDPSFAVAGAGTQGATDEKANDVKQPVPPAVKKGRPEYRLPLCLLGMLILPLGLFCFGWSAQNKVHWLLPLLGSFLTGMATILCFQTILVYLVDAFIPYSASATACAVLVRSILAAAFPLFAETMFAHLGFGWGSSLLAFVSLVAIPVPIVLYRYGEALRHRFKFQG